MSDTPAPLSPTGANKQTQRLPWSRPPPPPTPIPQVVSVNAMSGASLNDGSKERLSSHRSSSLRPPPSQLTSSTLSRLSRHFSSTHCPPQSILGVPIPAPDGPMWGGREGELRTSSLTRLSLLGQIGPSVLPVKNEPVRHYCLFFLFLFLLFPLSFSHIHVLFPFRYVKLSAHFRYKCVYLCNAWAALSISCTKGIQTCT